MRLFDICYRNFLYYRMRFFRCGGNCSLRNIPFSKRKSSASRVETTTDTFRGANLLCSSFSQHVEYTTFRLERSKNMLLSEFPSGVSKSLKNWDMQPPRFSCCLRLSSASMIRLNSAKILTGRANSLSAVPVSTFVTVATSLTKQLCIIASSMPPSCTTNTSIAWFRAVLYKQ